VFLATGAGVLVYVGAGDQGLSASAGDLELLDRKLGLDLAYQLKELLPSTLLERRHAGINPAQLLQTSQFNSVRIVRYYGTNRRPIVDWRRGNRRPRRSGALYRRCRGALGQGYLRNPRLSDYRRLGLGWGG
jgi:hypothetical protein